MDDASKKRRLDEITSPEKRLERANIANELLKLNEGGLCDQEVSQIVQNLSDFMGDFLQDEHLRRLDKIEEKLDCVATQVQVQQLEGQLTIVQAELVEKDIKIHDLEVSNADLRTRIEKLEKFADSAQFNFINAKNHSINNEQYQRKNNLIVFGVKEVAAGVKEDCRDAAFRVMKKCVPNLQKPDIDVAHRVGRVGPKPRPIIAKMMRHDVRREVLVARKALRGVKENGVSQSIGEDITNEYKELMNAITAKKFTCWFWNGKVWVQRSDGSSVGVHIQDNWELKVNDLTIKGRPPKTKLVARVVIDP